MLGSEHRGVQRVIFSSHRVYMLDRVRCVCSALMIERIRLIYTAHFRSLISIRDRSRRARREEGAHGLVRVCVCIAPPLGRDSDRA